MSSLLWTIQIKGAQIGLFETRVGAELYRTLVMHGKGKVVLL
jgi:hypothetical protein